MIELQKIFVTNDNIEGLVPPIIPIDPDDPLEIVMQITSNNTNTCVHLIRAIERMQEILEMQDERLSRIEDILNL